MFRKFLNARRSPSTPLPAIPEGERVYAIGDIHGRIDLLDPLLEAVRADAASRAPAATTLIFLGDLVDRGADSAAVIERVRTLDAPFAVRHLMGNHEEMFLNALAGEDKALRMFCRVGGRETVESYGMTAEAYNALGYPELLDEMRRLVPAAHRDFLSGFEDMIVIGDYAFVHAGIRPERPFAEQQAIDLRWIREPFLSHGKPLEKMIVHGHTVTESVEMHPHRIGVDTGAYRTGVLSVLGLEGTERWVIDSR